VPARGVSAFPANSRGCDVRGSSTHSKEEPMHARVSTYTTSNPDRFAEGFGRITDELKQMEGFERAYVLVDRERGKGMTITVWTSEEALEQSVAQADSIRKRGAGASDSSIESVEHFELSLTVE
jgi:heme-degrading monooxygenase HmoA